MQTFVLFYLPHIYWDTPILCHHDKLRKCRNALLIDLHADQI
jgi:hypothetical protein